MKSRSVRDLNLRAFGQHLFGLGIYLLSPRISLGAAPKPKPRAVQSINPQSTPAIP
ncbi:MAG: hypothetical protein HOC56_17090 [Anaerolineae bacterium]|nr:hypothetical protein [Anaerolineae bacterium]